MSEQQVSAPTAVVFVLEKDADERERMRQAVSDAGCAVLPLASVEQAVSLLRNHAVCDLLVVSTDVLGDSSENFDKLLAARKPAPRIIISGVDAGTKLALHCLNKGAMDFLAKPVDLNELLQAVEIATAKDSPLAEAAADAPDAIVGASHVAGWIELTATSQLEQFRRLQRFSDALFASRFPQEVCEDLKMAVEEVGRNAVEWGNRFSPDKQVHVSYCLFDDRVVIKVEDEGEGFTPQSLPDPTADPVKTMKDRANAGKRPGGYGVYLLQKLVDEIVYNEKGNTVLLIKYLPKGRTVT